MIASHIGTLALLPALVSADTTFVRQLPVDRTWFEQMVFVAGGVLTLLALGALIALIPAMIALRKRMRAATAAFDRFTAEMGPMLGHARSMAVNIEQTTLVVRSQAESVAETVSAANQAVRGLLTEAEARAREFSAFLKVVQEEAEGAFVSTAAAVRGARAATKAYRDGPELASARDLDAPPTGGTADFDEQEEFDGDDSRADADQGIGEGQQWAETPTPRVRPRPPGGIA
jgi:hypothetical protein